jgi:hypothetical protein
MSAIWMSDHVDPANPDGGKDILCEDCEKPIDDCKCYSPCCGEKMSSGNADGCFEDYGICPSCGEHV